MKIQVWIRDWRHDEAGPWNAMEENEVRGILVPVLAACTKPALSITSRARDARNVVCINRIIMHAPRDIPGDHTVDFHGAISMQIALSPFATDTTPRCDVASGTGRGTE